MNKKCAVCGNETPIINRPKLADNQHICSTCFKNFGYTILTPPHKTSADNAKNTLYEEKQNIFEMEIPGEILYELVGLSNTLSVYTNKINITYQYKDEETVPFSDILAVFYQRAGLHKGYIQLFAPKVNETHRGSKQEEIFIEFIPDQNEEAEKIYAHLTREFRKVKKPPLHDLNILEK